VAEKWVKCSTASVCTHIADTRAKQCWTLRHTRRLSHNALILTQSIRRRRPGPLSVRLLLFNAYRLCCALQRVEHQQQQQQSEPLHRIGNLRSTRDALSAYFLGPKNRSRRSALSAAEPDSAPKSWLPRNRDSRLSAGEACVAHVCFVCEHKKMGRARAPRNQYRGRAWAQCGPADADAWASWHRLFLLYTKQKGACALVRGLRAVFWHFALALQPPPRESERPKRIDFSVCRIIEKEKKALGGAEWAASAAVCYLVFFIVQLFLLNKTISGLPVPAPPRDALLLLLLFLFLLPHCCRGGCRRRLLRCGSVDVYTHAHTHTPAGLESGGTDAGRPIRNAARFVADKE
jgi:hypothetical protein